ncbi:heme-binding protein [Methylobacterium sp. BTF04]|uniref:SOUL family heme-binding protein n=1 Tax=Methylobacterium sp. BTF04 TaxID=2708300 RepID=UPI0013D7F5A1|nr:heme-binding protein [Methylobacterium sp. BTF04]NEU14841.1 heme-binding protein [Methylobacterium sp. BTF04]
MAVQGDLTEISIDVLAALMAVGIRGTYEEPRYAVVERLDRGVEVRAYEGRVAVETDARGTMRFYLLRMVVEAGAPEPTEPGVRLVRIPPERLAVLRFSGTASPAARDEKARILANVMETAGRKPADQRFFMGYDPPFSVPFLRRNEVALRLPSPSS